MSTIARAMALEHIKEVWSKRAVYETFREDQGITALSEKYIFIRNFSQRGRA